MESVHVTTPFGRRSMTLGMLATQMMSHDIDPAKTVDKWKIYRELCEAKPLLGITDRALAVLNALLSFYPKTEISAQNGLVVFPSNAQLSLRSHGMAEQTIRRHLAALVKAGLLQRKDSPNGKRYARRSREGMLDDAYGFSFAPLLARADEINRLATQVVAEKLNMQRLRERISLCRRDIAKLIEAAVAEEIVGDWSRIYTGFRSMIEGLPRTPSKRHLEMLLEDLEVVREDVINQLEMQIKLEKLSANPYQDERHIQNSDLDSISESEADHEKQAPTVSPNSEQAKDEPAAATSSRYRLLTSTSINKNPDRRASLKSFPLSLVLQACPDIADYGPAGIISNWRDLSLAATVVRSMLGVSQSAYEQACSVMGCENTATIMACILERGGQITSPGGYLRDLTRRAASGEFAIGPMLMALVRQNGSGAQKTG